MNIQAINMKSTKRRRQAAAKSTAVGKIYVVAGFLLIFGFLALSLNYRTWLNKKIAEIDKQTVACNRKIHELDREIEGLRIKKESLSSWAHIQDRIKVLRLNLTMPHPVQTQKLVVRFDNIPENKRSKKVSDTKVAMTE